MQATLIYNKNSGRTDQVTPEELQAALRQAGYYPVYEATEQEQDLDRILASVKGLVVAAGGDGTVRAVARRLLGQEAALSILPLGTANNISRALNIQGDPGEIIAGLKNPYRRPFDMGCVCFPWGTDYFVEGLGYGLYADMLANYDPDPSGNKDLMKAISSAVETIASYKSYPSRMALDGQDISGDYLLVEILNTTAVGPRIKLAPQAKPDDGLLEVVRVHENDRDSFLSYVTSLLSENLDELPSVNVNQGQKLDFLWTGFPIHVDGEIRSPEDEPSPEMRQRIENNDPISLPAEGAIVTVEIIPHAIELWLPQPEEEA